jgi:intracellular septation protein A
VVLSRRSALFLLLVGLFQWVVWPTFLRNIWADPRSFHDGPTAFLVVHAVLTAVQLLLATGLLVLGWRALRRTSV